jgi:hypothetical protein
MVARQTKFPSFQLTAEHSTSVLRPVSVSNLLFANTLVCSTAYPFYMGLTSSLLLRLELTGRDKGGYYHESSFRANAFISPYPASDQRVRVHGNQARRRPSRTSTFPFLPSTSPSKTLEVSMVSNMLASGPNMYGDTGAMSLQHPPAFPTFGPSLPASGALCSTTPLPYQRRSSDGSPARAQLLGSGSFGWHLILSMPVCRLWAASYSHGPWSSSAASMAFAFLSKTRLLLLGRDPCTSLG